MRYYNEAKTERAIRRKALFFTSTILFLFVSFAYFASSESARDVLPETVKEWFKEDMPKDQAKKTKDQA